MGWSHPFNGLWSTLEEDYWIPDDLLPCTAFQYKIDVDGYIFLDSSQRFESKNYTVEWIVWVETPTCRAEEDPGKPLVSPFGQKVTLRCTFVAQEGLLFVWWFSNEHITDRPEELGFTEDDEDPFQYPIVGNKAEQGYIDPASGSDYGQAHGQPVGYIDSRWTSPEFEVAIPSGSRFRIFKKTAGPSALFREATIQIRTYGGVIRYQLEKDSTSRLHRPFVYDYADGENGQKFSQIVVGRAINDLSSYVPVGRTQSLSSKLNPSLHFCGDGSLVVLYETSEGVRCEVSKDGGITVE